MPSSIALKRLTKRFVSAHDPVGESLVVDGVNLEVLDGEFLVMVGPSGCGKTTILRMIAGLEEPTEGEIYLDGQRVDDWPARTRHVGFLFQGYALFKHMTVAQNIAFGLRIMKMPKAERQNRTEELVALLGLEGLEGRVPGQLSGGQQQRVALARALAPRPRVLLLDEPFGDVDAKMRPRLRADTKRWQRELGISTILVTHDQREALELGDRVVVMNEGRFEQVDSPRNVYDSPATEFVGRFIGRANVFLADPGKGWSRLMNTRSEIMVRPEDISIFPWEGQQLVEERQIPGTIVSYAFLGRTVRIEVQLKSGKLVTVALPKHEAPANDFQPGKEVTLAVGSRQVSPLRPDSPHRSPASPLGPGRGNGSMGAHDAP